MRTKKLICIVMSLLLMLPLSMVANAAVVEENEIMPLYSYTNITAISLSIASDGDATCYSEIQGYDGITTSLHITMTLQKKTVLWWSEVDSWEITANKVETSMTRHATVGSGTYRVKAVFTAYSGSASEEITDYSQEKKFTAS